jgi:hypothetical protein
MCPVCGYPDLDERPHGKATGGSYEICPSCGFQFGVSNEDQGFTYQQCRQRWIDLGKPWQSIGVAPPKFWNPEEQLKNLRGSLDGH